MSTAPISTEPSGSVALESILRTKRLRKYAPSIRALISIWIKDEQISGLRIESTLRPIVLFFENAPGLQKQQKGYVSLTTKELALQMRDMHFRTDLAPCMLKVLVALRYTEDHLDSLSLQDFQRLEAMILAVRKELHIETVSSSSGRIAAEVVHARGTE
jgi:hypothetical protein